MGLFEDLAQQWLRRVQFVLLGPKSLPICPFNPVLRELARGALGSYDNVSIPLRFRAVHREQIECVALEYEPDRDRDCLPRFPADHADFDLLLFQLPLKRPERDVSGWVFYLWEERTDLLPAWKSSYVRKAVAPDGKTYFVGSGSSRMKVEKVFVRDRVEEAARLVQEQKPYRSFITLEEVAGGTKPLVLRLQYGNRVQQEWHIATEQPACFCRNRATAKIRKVEAILCRHSHQLRKFRSDCRAAQIRAEVLCKAGEL